MFKKRTALVTCMYNDLDGTPYGGRLNRKEFYRESLKTIAEASMEHIFCFLPQHDINETIIDFSTIKHNITFIPFEIDGFPYSEDIQRIKRSYSHSYSGHEWMERCVEIMWGKFYLLNRVIDTFAKIDKIYWIDAGLANTEIISPRYSPNDSIDNGRIHDVKSAFNNGLFKALSKYTQNKILFITCTRPHSERIPERYLANKYTSGSGVIGGLFGGRTDLVRELSLKFMNLCDNIIRDEVLYFEEGIMTGILNDHPSLFKVFEFDSWYHEGWGTAHDPNLVCFNDFINIIRDKADSEISLLQDMMDISLGIFDRVIQLIRGGFIYKSDYTNKANINLESDETHAQNNRSITFISSLFLNESTDKPDINSGLATEALKDIEPLIFNEVSGISLFLYCRAEEACRIEKSGSGDSIHLEVRSEDDFRSHYLFQRSYIEQKNYFGNDLENAIFDESSLMRYLDLARIFLLNDAAILNPHLSTYFVWVDHYILYDVIKSYKSNPNLLIRLLDDAAGDNRLLFILGMLGESWQNWIPYDPSSSFKCSIFGGTTSEISYLNAKYYRILDDAFTNTSDLSLIEATGKLIKDNPDKAFVIHG